MHMKPASKGRTRLAADAGIAIGPILFIIAVLGILAAAIAAGSGSFTTKTTNEGARSKAAALIEIGQTLKVGMDRILASGDNVDATGANITAATVDIAPGHTTDKDMLFSPIGGGVGEPSNTMSKNPTSAADVWFYPMMHIPNIGTAAASYGGVSGNRVAAIEVTPEVCDEINLKANGIAVPAVPGASAGGLAAGAATALGDFTTAATTTLPESANWPAALAGKPVGCVQNATASAVVATGPGANSYWFYQVIFVQ